MLKRYGQGKYFHRAVEVGETIYLPSVTAHHYGADTLEQAGQTAEKIEALLKELGSDRSKIVMANSYLTDMGPKDAMNEAWVEFFAPGELPSRATIGVADLGEGVLIETVCVAVK